MTDSLYAQLLATGKQAKAAATALLKTTDHQKSKVLYALANALRAHTAPLLAANQQDIIAAEKNHLAAPLLDRLRITEASIEKMAAGVEQIARLPDPVRSQTDTRILPNGIRISQMRMPIGVIGIIYESRPNVTIDAAVLCLKSGNACILRGGSEALHSNQALAAIIRNTLTQHDFPVDAVSVIDTTDRAVVQHMVQLTEYIDVIIPRGGKSLLQRLKDEAKVPMILHLDGNCHVYVDEFANLTQAVSTAVNAKTYRYGICGAMETLLVHESVAAQFLPQLAEALTPFAVEIRGCPSTCSILHQATPATEEDWYEEFLAPILAIKVVPTIDAAIFHIERYGSQHTDSILTESITRAQQFQSQVTSSSVLVNLPTCFADGFEYGLGAEIGISTNKLHARGPVGLEGLTTYKWVLVGEGQLRSPHQ